MMQLVKKPDPSNPGGKKDPDEDSGFRARDLLKAVYNIQPLTDKEFGTIRDIIYRQTGIKLNDGKRALVMGRLHKVLTNLGMSDYTAYLDYIQADKSGRALGHMIDRITTNHTFFYRESEHFELMQKDILPRVVALPHVLSGKKLRIWSAGCSTGEEAYDLAMCVREFFREQLNKWDVAILASDISSHTVHFADRGIYPAARLQEMPASLRVKYFKKIENGDFYEVRPELKDMITFRILNLKQDDYPFRGKFDIIFCRNVMIYFDDEVRYELVDRFFRYTHPGGYLIISHSENLYRTRCPFKNEGRSIYRKI